MPLPSSTLKKFLMLFVTSARDLVPLLLVVGIFQALVIRTPIDDLGQILLGLILVVIGLTLFVQGLALTLFPLGGIMANALIHQRRFWLLLVFAFAIGFGSTVAEPALLAVVTQAANAAVAEGLVADEPQAIAGYIRGLRYSASVAVGLAVVLGVLRLIKGWPALWFVLGGHLVALLLALVSPLSIIGIAYDAGASATSAINIPLITAFGVGLATAVHGRNPMVDGFGMIALASLMPIVTILCFNML